MGCEGCFQSGKLQAERYQVLRAKAISYVRESGTAVIIYKEPQMGDFGFVEANKFATLHPGEFVEYLSGMADIR